MPQSAEPESVRGDNDHHAYIETVIDKSEVEFLSKYFLQLGTEAKVIEPCEIMDRIRHYPMSFSNSILII